MHETSFRLPVQGRIQAVMEIGLFLTLFAGTADNSEVDLMADYLPENCDSAALARELGKSHSAIAIMRARSLDRLGSSGISELFSRRSMLQSFVIIAPPIDPFVDRVIYSWVRADSPDKKRRSSLLNQFEDAPLSNSGDQHWRIQFDSDIPDRAFNINSKFNRHIDDQGWTRCGTIQ
jgi:hypothetical protein